MAKRFFVTGATGFIGSWVAQQLVETGQQVTCLVRKTSNLKWLKDLPVEYHYGSLLEPQTLKDGVQSADYVLHIAGVTKALSPEEFYKGNVQATRNLLEMIREENPGIKKFVHVSSQAAMGPSPSTAPADEESPMQPLTDYGRSKMQSEHVAREYMDTLPLTILRPPAVYGPRDTDVFEVFKNVRNRFNLKVGNIEPVVSIVHVFDLARGIILAAEHPGSGGETYFICNEEPCAWSDVIDILQKLMNKKVLNIPVPYPLAYSFGAVLEAVAHLSGKPTILNRQKIREVNAKYWVASPRKIREQLGYTSLLSLEEGLKNTLEWYREHKWL
jgi:nucleoside-diphosphate-sugar epimerase